MSAPQLTVEDLYVRFPTSRGTVEAVNGVNFTASADDGCVDPADLTITPSPSKADFKVVSTLPCTRQAKVVWTAAEPCGDYVSEEATFTVRDTTPPLMVGGEDKVINCTASAAAEFFLFRSSCAASSCVEIGELNIVAGDRATASGARGSSLSWGSPSTQDPLQRTAP